MEANVNGTNQPAEVEIAGKEEIVFTNIPQIEVSEKAQEGDTQHARGRACLTIHRLFPLWQAR